MSRVFPGKLGITGWAEADFSAGCCAPWFHPWTCGQHWRQSQEWEEEECAHSPWCLSAPQLLNNLQGTNSSGSWSQAHPRAQPGQDFMVSSSQSTGFHADIGPRAALYIQAFRATSRSFLFSSCSGLGPWSSFLCGWNLLLCKSCWERGQTSPRAGLGAQWVTQPRPLRILPCPEEFQPHSPSPRDSQSLGGSVNATTPTPVDSSSPRRIPTPSLRDLSVGQPWAAVRCLSMVHTFPGGHQGMPPPGSIPWDIIPSWTPPKSINFTQFSLTPSCRPRVLFPTAAPQTFPHPRLSQPVPSPPCPGDDWKQMEQDTDSPSFSICHQLLLAPF